MKMLLAIFILLSSLALPIYAGVSKTFEELFESGIIRGKNNDHKGAIRDFDEAIKLDKKNSLIFGLYYNRGIAKFRSGNYKEAILDFNLAIETYEKIDGIFLDAYFYRGRSFSNLDKKDRAIKDFNFVIKNNPSDYKALINRGNLMARKKEFEKAINDYDLAKKINSYEIAIYLNKSNLMYSDLNDQKGACQELKKALSINREITQKWIFNHSLKPKWIKQNWCSITDKALFKPDAKQ